MCRVNDKERVNSDSEDDDDDDDDYTSTHISTCQSSAVTAWDLTCAALQVQQMVEPKYRNAPLGNCLD